MPYGSKLHIPPTNYHLLAAQQEPYKKSLITHNEKCLRVFWREQSQENGPLAEKSQDTKNKTGQKKKGDKKGESNDSQDSRQGDKIRHPWPTFKDCTGCHNVNSTRINIHLLSPCKLHQHQHPFAVML